MTVETEDLRKRSHSFGKGRKKNPVFVLLLCVKCLGKTRQMEDRRFDLAEGQTASKGIDYSLLLFRITGFKKGSVKGFLVESIAFLKVTGKPAQDNEIFFYIYIYTYSFQKSLHVISVILRAP